MGRHSTINYALAATLLAAGQSYSEIAPKVGAKSVDTLRTGLCRKGVNKKTALNPTGTLNVNKSVCLRVAHQAYDLLREKSESNRVTHADVAVKVAEHIANTPLPKHANKLNQYVDTWQKAVKGSATVFGWDEQRNSALVITGMLSGAIAEEPEQPAIEVESVPQVDTSECPEVS